MACGLYEEASNALKVALVGVAVGAAFWFFAGSGVKEGHDKRKREREKEAHEREVAKIKAGG